MVMDEHERYGAEKFCGECGGQTILARQYTTSPTEPKQVQSRCMKLACAWRGRPIDTEASVIERPVEEHQAALF